MLKDERFHLRGSLRGLKKCPSCYHYNGIRAKGCINQKCPLHFLKKLKKTTTNVLDAVKLISHNESNIYSVRSKEREPDGNKRNFVQITDTKLSSDSSDGSEIISRNAICYVDTCKYDSSDVNLSCKHVKCATDCQISAQEIQINKTILFNLKIDNDLKINLWNLYKCNELIIPVLQRINKSTFVVKCTANTHFPSGLLHIVVKPDNDGDDFDYTCACKKLKILLSPNNTSVVLENDICDHLLLVLAGILSSPHLQKQFQNLLNTFKTLWDYNDLQIGDDDVFDDDFLQDGDLYNFNESILNSAIELDRAEDISENIFENGHDCTLNGNNNTDSIQLIGMETTIPTTTSNILDTTMNPSSLSSPSTLTSLAIPILNANENNDECLELSDCQIELMDQFKLTDQIELNYDVLMDTDDVFMNHGDTLNLINELEDVIVEETPVETATTTAVAAVETATLSSSAVVVNNTVETPTPPAPLLPLPTRTATTTKILNTNKKPSINKNKITNGAIKNKRRTDDDNNRHQKEIHQNELQQPSLEFNEWLEFVIEQINMSIDANTKDTNIKHVFSTKNDFFECLSQKFGINGKRRIPNDTVIIKKGKLRGLPQSKWIFNAPSIIKRIFSTAESQIETERYFTKISDGSYKLFELKNEINNDNSTMNKYKKILPVLLCTFIKLDSCVKENCDSFIVEWIPNVFSKSRFGIMKIEFSIGFRDTKKS